MVGEVVDLSMVVSGESVSRSANENRSLRVPRFQVLSRDFTAID